MNERLEKKIRKLLAKAGLSEDKVNDIVDDVNEEVAEGVGEENKGNPAEDTALIVPHQLLKKAKMNGIPVMKKVADFVPPVVRR